MTICPPHVSNWRFLSAGVNTDAGFLAYAYVVRPRTFVAPGILFRLDSADSAVGLVATTATANRFVRYIGFSAVVWDTWQCEVAFVNVDVYRLTWLVPIDPA